MAEGREEEVAEAGGRLLLTPGVPSGPQEQAAVPLSPQGQR